jgi:hypothetical protein
MPEQVYPTPNADGTARTWNEVFPIWANKDDQLEWRIIDSILEAIAMNNRFGSKTPEELEFSLAETAQEKLARELDKAGDNLEERQDWLRSYGAFTYYLPLVFQNLGGAYRVYKDQPRMVEREAINGD